jgi:YaiO family outer membrane protein
LSLAVATSRTQTPTPYEEAVDARRAENPTRAILLLQPWLRANPNDADALLQSGYALLDLHRLSEADEAFQQVLRLAPDYADAWMGRARVASERGNFRQARAWLDHVPSSNADANSLRKRLALGQARWRLDATFSRTAVNHGQPDWREADFEVGHDISSRLTLSSRAEFSRRFGLHDTYAEFQAYSRISPRISAYILAGGTPRAAYRPRWQLGGGLTGRISGGRSPTLLSGDFRIADFRSGQVATAQAGVEQYLMSGNASVTGRLIALTDASGFHMGVFAKADVQAARRLRLFAGGAVSPDTSAGLVTRTRSLFGGATFAISGAHTVRFSIARTDQQLGPTRLEISLGGGARF